MFPPAKYFFGHLFLRKAVILVTSQPDKWNVCLFMLSGKYLSSKAHLLPSSVVLFLDAKNDKCKNYFA